ncbi:unnamed protein product [Phytophthora fragariaefolia]|uniref:Unnamed protein product n=1 Tax=Phytophthora fragariaefolia TaxID=1490495 RepID=A0A9W6XKD8_9STRA|nr:unnamed protein product [Phytophthora fragariaefolia]
MRRTDGDAVVTSTNVRVVTGTTRRSGNSDVDDDVVVMMSGAGSGDSPGGRSGAGDQGGQPAMTERAAAETSSLGTRTMLGMIPPTSPGPLALPPTTPAVPTTPMVIYREWER